MEPEETYIARQHLYKQVSATTYTQATIEELLGTLFSVKSVQSGYKRRELVIFGVSLSCGGWVEYLHRNPVSHRKRRKGKSRI
jgi:hypothetical protein